jgi:hypothetical protein
MDTLPSIGDRVIIELGGHDTEGEVVHISRTLTPPRITIDFWLEGADGPTRITYPADWVRPAEPLKH